MNGEARKIELAHILGVFGRVFGGFWWIARSAILEWSRDFGVFGGFWRGFLPVFGAERKQLGFWRFFAGVFGGFWRIFEAEKPVKNGGFWREILSSFWGFLASLLKKEG